MKTSITNDVQLNPVDDFKLLKKAQEMEAVFLEYMMKAMRKTLDSEAQALEIYQHFIDVQFAQLTAQIGFLGIADLTIDYLKNNNKILQIE